MPVLPGMPVITLRRLAGLQARIDPRDLARFGRDRGVDEQPLERMIEIPVVDQMLVVPDDLAGRGIERERRVVIEVLLVVAAEDELRRGNRDRRADVDLVEHGVVARHHPRADVPALLHRHVAPGLVAGLARRGIVRVRHSSLPVFASCAVITQTSNVAAGWHWRPVITLPFATIGPADRVRGQRRLEHLRLPDAACRARVDRVDLLSPPAPISVVAPDRDAALRAAVHALGELALYSQSGAPVLPSNAWM